jgi:NitT/TauT family transport system permease protein
MTYPQRGAARRPAAGARTAAAGARLLPLAVVLGALGVWAVLSARGVLTETTQFPPLPAVAEGFQREWASGRLVNDIRASLLRVGVGFALAALLGVPLGLWLGQRFHARAALLPVVNFFRSLSPLAWIGFAILWFGIGSASAIFLIFMATFFPIVLATVAAVAGIPTVYFRVARDYGFGGAALLTKVTLPAILPQVVTALRVTAGLAWVVVVAAEMTGAQEGLGYAIHDARNGQSYDLLVVVMIVIGAIRRGPGLAPGADDPHPQHPVGL